MRATLGILLIFLGAVVGYLVISGKFPSSSPTPTTTPTTTPPNPNGMDTSQAQVTVIPGASANEIQQANILKNKNYGGGAFGINMGAVNGDTKASSGGFKDFSSVHNFPTGSQLNDETSRRGNRR